MASLPRPLWEILLAAESGNPCELTCEECLAVIAYLADALASEADPQSVTRAARRHLAHCPDCRQHHARRLRELEILLTAPENSTGA